MLLQLLIFEFRIKKHDILIYISLIIWYIDFVTVTTYIFLSFHVSNIEFLIMSEDRGLLCYTSVKI